MSTSMEGPGGDVGGGSSRSSFSYRKEPIEGCRNYGVTDGGGYATAASDSPPPLGKFEVRGRRASILDKIEGSNDVDNSTTFRNSMMRERKVILESDGGNEKDLDYRSLSLVKRRRANVVDNFGENNDIYNDTAFGNNMMSERGILLENDISFVQDEKNLDYRNFNSERMRRTSIVDSSKTAGNDVIDNDIAFGSNMISERRSLFENDISFGEDEKNLDYRSLFMKIRSTNEDKIEGNYDTNNDIAFGRSERRILLANDFSEDGNDLDGRCLNLNPEDLQFVEDYGYESHGVSSGSSGDGLERIPLYHEELFSTVSTSQRLVSAEEAFGMRLKRKRSFEMEINTDDQKIVSSCDWTNFDEIAHSSYGDKGWTYEDIEQLSMLQNSRQGQYQGRGTGMMTDEMAIHRNAISENSSPKYIILSEKRHSNTPVKPSRIDVRKRLGPVQSVKQRLGPAPNARKRTTPKVKRRLPWVNIQGRKTIEDFDPNVNVQRVKSSLVKTGKPTREKPEDSEEFMQLVQNAFLKFVKVLNENSATRRKFLEQGAGTLKCCICGSFKEFADTLSLAQHAFTSCKVGSRPEHLGFGKALCVMMGWNSQIVPNHRWIWQMLPAAEASSLKEDLIIWPPVVLIHNSSTANNSIDERMIVSIQGLKDILRGMGCDQGMTNLCRGKAADYSTMVVTFSGTFSGLQEAERLHKLFGDKKHGRAEFQQINFSGRKKNRQDIQRAPVDKVESVLYGYMGIAGDLDKLDFGTNKWCVVKSKKEIAAIANASPNSR